MAEEADLDLASGDAGACRRMQAGDIRKGSHIVIKGRPCKVRAPRTATAQGGPGGRCFRVCSEPWEGRMRRPGAAPGVSRAPQEGCG